eukprot:gene6969-9576_t
MLLTRTSLSTARAYCSHALPHAVISEDIARLQELVFQSQNIVALTGAGISTDSGIPDYRSPGRPPYRPLQHIEFIQSEYTRKRYWARSAIGYPRLCRAAPNHGHKALTDLQSKGKLSAIITQNVDELHQRAGAVNVLNLHGTIHRVNCLTCQQKRSRVEYQEEILHHNAYLKPFVENRVDAASVRPDGDMELSEKFYRSFNLVHCPHDEGWMKPDVVFFGDSIRPEVVERSYNLLDSCDFLLVSLVLLHGFSTMQHTNAVVLLPAVIGTSLQVWSSLRLVRRANKLKTPVAIITNGSTRGDEYANIRLRGSISSLLPLIFDL